MDRRTYLLLTGGSLILVAALLGTPLWDLWYYRPLRSSPGSSVPVAVLVTAPAGSPQAYPPGPRVPPIAAAAEPARALPATPPLAAPARPGRERIALGAPGEDPVAPRRDPTTKVREIAPAEQLESSPEDRPVEEPAAAREAPNPPPAPAVFYQIAPTPLPPGVHPGPAPHDDPLREEPGSARILPPPEVPDDADPEAPAGPPVVSLIPDSFELLPGEALVVTVQVSDAVSMSSLPFHLTFDPEVLEFVDSQTGPALAGTHEPVLLASVNPNRPGDLAVGLSLVESSGLFSGSGALVRLRFRAVAQGESDLDFDRASMRGATGRPLDARFEKTRIKVQ